LPASRSSAPTATASRRSTSAPSFASIGREGAQRRWPPARFGGLELEGDRVVSFVEKPQLSEGWINGGFFVFEPAVLDRITNDATLLEHEPLSGLARDGQLSVFRHEGFWQPMDTLRDKRLLEELWASGAAPWVPAAPAYAQF
jgi:glucose-1-phosphate cytidylyltransferase